MGGDRGPALKKVAKIPPGLLRGGGSLAEYDLTTGGAVVAGSLPMLGRRTGFVDKSLLIGSRAETFLTLVSWCCPMKDMKTLPAHFWFLHPTQGVGAGPGAWSIGCAT